MTWKATHTVDVRVYDSLTGKERVKPAQPVRVTDTRIEDSEGRLYDRHMHGRQTGPKRLMYGSTYRRNLLLDTLRRLRVRL